MTWAALLATVAVVALGTPFLTWAVTRWADREQRAEQERRVRLDRIMRASTPPSAPGLRPHRRQVR